MLPSFLCSRLLLLLAAHLAADGRLSGAALARPMNVLRTSSIPQLFLSLSFLPLLLVQASSLLLSCSHPEGSSLLALPPHSTSCCLGCCLLLLPPAFVGTSSTMQLRLSEVWVIPTAVPIIPARLAVIR
jgi:hypothetical protein